MTEHQAAARIHALSSEIRRHEHAYHVLALPEISDSEFDGMIEALMELEGQYPHLIASDSPTRRVGSDLTQDLTEVKHTVPVLSLDKEYDPGQLNRWMKKTKAVDPETSFIIEEKIDGASILLHYSNGVLERAITRGNGLIGNDVTANVSTIQTVPLRLNSPETLTVRGEIFIRRAAFSELNSRIEIPYANARNFAAGSLRRVRSKEVARLPLEVFIYEGYLTNPPATHAALIVHLRELGFRINPSTVVIKEYSTKNPTSDSSREFSVIRTDDALEYIRKRMAERANLDYDIDGLVLKVDNLVTRDLLGSTEHHPRWAIAVKFDSPEGISVVRAINAQVGRTGRVTPIARIDPVLIAGSMISNVTLHNQDYIDSLELAVGDTVAVSKRGEVIPAIERVINKNRTISPIWHMPIECPSCGGALTIRGAHCFCSTYSCPDQIRGRLRFFVGRNQMDIAGLGPATINLLVDRGWVKDIADLFRFDADYLLDEEGFAERTVAALKRSIESSKEKPFSTVLPSIGLADVGPKITSLLMQAGFHGIDQLYAAVDAASTQEQSKVFTDIDGIGERTATGLIQQLGDPANRRLIKSLRLLGLKFADSQTPATSANEAVFAGQAWCITGSFETFVPRSIAADEIRARGGTVTSTISGATTHLLEGKNAGSKAAKAKASGAQIVDEQAFLLLLNKPKYQTS